MEIKARQRLEEVGLKASFKKKQRRRWGLSELPQKEDWVKRFLRKPFIIEKKGRQVTMGTSM